MPPTLALPRRAVAAPRLRRRPAGRAVALAAVVLVALAGAFLWLRDSSLVAVRQVSVLGLSGPQAPEIRKALEAAARDMTTLHVRADALRSAVEPYPVVRDVEVRRDLPHRLRIIVHEHLPLAGLTSPAGRVAVAADGSVLRDTPVDGLPVVTGSGAIVEGRVDARAQRAIAVLAAAPDALRARVRRLYVGARGWTAPLDVGPVLYLGTASRLAAKWAAATRVLADPTAAGATYLDLRLPERPAAGAALAPPSASTQGSG